MNVRFRGECVAKLFSRPKRAILIQDERSAQEQFKIHVQADSIIARSQCSKEFCNTIGGKADIALNCCNVCYWPKADIAAALSEI